MIEIFGPHTVSKSPIPAVLCWQGPMPGVMRNHTASGDGLTYIEESGGESKCIWHHAMYRDLAS